MKIKRAIKSFRSFSAGAAGVSEGDLVPDGHPLVKKYPQYFENVEDYVGRKFPNLVNTRAVETATAEPGERRSVRKARVKSPESENEAES